MILFIIIEQQLCFIAEVRFIAINSPEIKFDMKGSISG